MNLSISSLLFFQNLQLPEYQEKVKICASEIMNKYSEVQSSIVYENMGKIVDHILDNEMPNTTRIINIKSHLKYSSNELEPYYMLTVIIENINELEKYFNAIYRVLGWNSRAKHFIIYLGQEDIDRIFYLSWEKFITKLIVLDRHQDLYTYYPMRDGSCGNHIKKHFLFTCKKKQFATIDAVFMHNKISNFNSCEIKVLATPIVPYVIDVDDPKYCGFEITVLRELSKRLNFTIKYVKTNYSYWGYKTVNSTYTQMFKLFFKREADIMLGMLVANGSFLYDFDSSIAYSRSDLAFYVPSAKKIDPWKNIMKVYKKMIWLLIVASICFITTFWYAIGKFERSKINTVDFNNVVVCWFFVMGILLCKSMKQPNDISFRFIFLSWTVFSLVMTSTFESSLMSLLTKPAYETEINTIQQLATSPLHVGGYAYARELFGITNENEYYMKIYKRWIDCDLNEYCTNQTAFQRNFAALNDVRQINYLTPKYYINSDGSNKIHSMQITASFYIWMLMLKGFPLRDTINHMIQRFSEHGLLNKWIDDVSYIHNPISFIQHTPLSMKHIQFPLRLMYLGIVLSTLVFFMEMLYNRIKKFKTQ